MSVTTRSTWKKQEMATNTVHSRKLDDLLSKMDVLIEAKDDMVEETQSTILKDVEELKKSFRVSDQKIADRRLKR